jgi:hypothetical protein
MNGESLYIVLSLSAVRYPLSAVHDLSQSSSVVAGLAGLPMTVAAPVDCGAAYAAAHALDVPSNFFMTGGIDEAHPVYLDSPARKRHRSVLVTGGQG